MKIIIDDNEWNKVKDALAYAYSRGWYDRCDGETTDKGKMEVAEELFDGLKKDFEVLNQDINSGIKSECFDCDWIGDGSEIADLLIDGKVVKVCPKCGSLSVQ